MTPEQKILRRCKRRVKTLVRTVMNSPHTRVTFRRVDGDHLTVAGNGFYEGDLFPKEQVLRRNGVRWDLSVSPPERKPLYRGQ